MTVQAEGEEVVIFLVVGVGVVQGCGRSGGKGGTALSVVRKRFLVLSRHVCLFVCLFVCFTDIKAVYLYVVYPVLKQTRD